MHEIKFRGKSVNTGKWIYGYLCKFKDKYVLNDYMVNEETIGQFTGKTDKAKKEIFSGDLLKDQDGVIYEVWYSEDAAAFMAEMVNPANDMVDILGGYDTGRCFEVIGNIYDNKDLLED